jgi:hypothetical protein
MPEIALPFAIVGAAAGWLSADFLTNPLVDLSMRCNREFAATSAALVAAAVGRWLTRRFGARAMWIAAESATWVHLVTAVSLGGAITGAAVGWLTWFTARGFFYGAAAGLLCTIPFFPVCALVVAAARRAERARLGSIVAGSDRRAMWSIMMAALAGVTLIALPEWIPLGNAFATAPHVARTIALGAGVVALGLLIVDGIALRRVARVGVAGMELRGPGADEEEGDPAPDLDFGLGDEVMARMARGGAAYRTRERTVALVLGSVAQARAAIRQAIKRGAIGLAFIGAVLTCHALDVPRESFIAYHEGRCFELWAPSCRAAGSLLEASPGSDSRRERTLRAYRLGCENGNAGSCRGFTRVERRAVAEYEESLAANATILQRR